MSFCAEDIMTRNVLCVYEDMDLRDLAKLLLEKKITGAPVTARDGRLLGVVSQTDLLRYGLSREEELVVDSGFYHAARMEGRHLPKGFQVGDVNSGTAADVMTPLVHAVKPSTPVEDVARLMRRHHVHRVIVERDERVAGLVSVLDLVAVLSAVPTRRKRATKKK